MPIIDEELVANGKAHFGSKVDFSDNTTFGKNVEIDGKMKVNEFSDIVDKDGNNLEKYSILSVDILDYLATDDALELFDYIGNSEFNSYKIYDFITNKKIQNTQLYNEIVFNIPAPYSNIYKFRFIKCCDYTSNFFLIFNGNAKQDNNWYIILSLLSSSINAVDAIKAQKVNISELANISDLASKQPTLYRHTVTIKGYHEAASTEGYALFGCFTAESEKNITIDSIQDLISVFGNTDLTMTGSGTNYDEDGAMAILLKIHIGTSINDTILYVYDKPNGDYNLEFTDAFGSSGFTISDNVTAM